jgi:membrane associated rhomboid family serine protease
VQQPFYMPFSVLDTVLYLPRVVTSWAHAFLFDGDAVIQSVCALTVMASLGPLSDVTYYGTHRMSGWTLWRATTSMWTHHDRWHLLLNMVFLIVTGPSLLRAYQHDSLSFMLLYAFTSYTATMLSLWCVHASMCQTTCRCVRVCSQNAWSGLHLCTVSGGAIYARLRRLRQERMAQLSV